MLQVVRLLREGPEVLTKGDLTKETPGTYVGSSTLEKSEEDIHPRQQRT